MKRAARAPLQSVTLMDHVRELRTRLFFVAALFLVASSLAYTFREPIISMLLSPLEGEKLIYLNPAGGFNFIFMVSMYVGLAITTPLLIQQLYGFVKPALPQAIQHYSGRIFVGSLVLLVSGISFGYFFAIPGALRFLYGFANDYIQASLTADSYLSFLVAYTIGLGLVFQIPLLLMFFHWIKPMTPGGLLKSERWVILLSFIAAALITPTPDPLNQTIIAIPIIFVYQIGVFGVLLTIRKQRRREKLAATAIATVPVATPAPVLVVPAAQPAAAATPVFQPSTPQPKRRVRSIDGVMRSATPHRTMAIPERPTTIKQAAMTARRPTPLHRRPRYTLDGISRPLSAA